jgi:hypothetical protein
MFAIFFWAIVFSLAGAGVTVLLGDRNLLNGNLLHWEKFLSVIFHWKFLTAVFLSFVARYSFTPHQFQVISEVIDSPKKKPPSGSSSRLLNAFS